MHYYTEQLDPDKYYHVYNHAVGKDNLFDSESNYRFFLIKYAEFLSPFVKTYAYCLMPNHFHLLIQVRSENELELILSTLSKKKVIAKSEYPLLISKQFSNLFSSYSQAYNKTQNRNGTLFRKPFKRLHIDSEDYIRSVIRYIHYNPEHHQFTNDFRSWKFSSFTGLISNKQSLLKKDEVMDLFDDRENFIAFHKKDVEEELIQRLDK